MSTADRVMRFGKSQLYGMHFERQRAPIVRRKGNLFEMKAFVAIGR